MAVCHNLQVLRHLDLSGNDLGDRGINAIVQRATQLLWINLSQTGTTATGLIHIANWMALTAGKIQLQHLDLSKNHLGDKGMKTFCAAITMCTQLQTVNLSACQLGCNSGRLILSMIKELSVCEAAYNRHHSLQVCGEWTFDATEHLYWFFMLFTVLPVRLPILLSDWYAGSQPESELSAGHSHAIQHARTIEASTSVSTIPQPRLKQGLRNSSGARDM